MNGMAARAAVRTLRERLAPLAAEYFAVAVEDVRFADNLVRGGGRELPAVGVDAARPTGNACRCPRPFLRHAEDPLRPQDLYRFGPFFYFAYGCRGVRSR